MCPKPVTRMVNEHNIGEVLNLHDYLQSFDLSNRSALSAAS